MKKTLSFMVMAFALLFAQCRKPEVKFPSPVAPEGVTVSMTVTAGPGSKTDITADGGITWSSGDRLYVGFDGKYVGCLEIKNSSGTWTGLFSGNVTLPSGTTGEQTFHFFYLGSGDYTGLTEGSATSVDVSFAEQEIYNNNGKLENASKHHVGYGTAKGTVKDGVVTGINVTMVSKVALARFSFTKNSTAYDGALTLSGDNIYNDMTVGFGGTFTGKTKGNISLTGSHSERYVMLVPTGASAEQTLTFAGSAEDGEGMVPGLESNKFYGKTGAIAVSLKATAVHVESVSLDKPELSLKVGENETLTATVLPGNATDKSVTWSSSATGVATVSETGLVTAVAAGSATITVTTADGGKTATCAVTVTPKFEFSVGPNTTVEFAPGNLYYDGSSWKFEANQWDFRTYAGKNSCINGSVTENGTPSNNWGLFGWSTSSTDYGMSTSTNGSDYSGDFVDWGTAPGLPSAGEGKTWRTLTADEWKYLIGEGNPCRANASSLRAWKDFGGNIKGLVILPDGTKNPSTVLGSITTTNALATFGAVFLPAAGYRSGTGVKDVGSTGYYWSSTPYKGDGRYAYYMGFFSGYVGTVFDSRNGGYAVRLVR